MGGPRESRRSPYELRDANSDAAPVSARESPFVHLRVFVGSLGVVLIALGAGLGLGQMRRAVRATPEPETAAAAAAAATPTVATTTVGARAGLIALADTAEHVRATLGEPDRSWLPGGTSPEWLYTGRYVVRLSGTHEHPGEVWQVIAYSGSTAEGFRVGDDKATFKRIYAAFDVRSIARGWEGASGPIDQLEITRPNVILAAEFAPTGTARYISVRRPPPPMAVATPRTLPPPAPPSCAAAAAPASIPALLPTTPGRVTTRVVRDDAWTRPALVPGAFLIWSAPSEPAYREIVCRSEYLYGYGNSEGSKMLLAIGEPHFPTLLLADSKRPATLDNPMPGLGLMLWLMGVHFQQMSANASGVVTVQVERRPGLEWVLFDLEAVARSPHGSGSLEFRFVDAAGNEVDPPIVRGVEASWEYGRAQAP